MREELAQHNFSGEFLFLLNHVFPTAIAPSGSTICEGMFGQEMHQYIVGAATAPSVDHLIQPIQVLCTCSSIPIAFYWSHNGPT